MLGRIKKVLGIEGVKLELICEPQYEISEGKITGIMKFTTQSPSRVDQIVIQLIEKYSRGRGQSKLVDEYQIGKVQLDEPFDISPDEIIEIPFEIEYQIQKSEMDRLQLQHFVFIPLVSLAKKIKNVKSTFTLVAEAYVKGTTLHPFDKKQVKLV